MSNYSNSQQETNKDNTGLQYQLQEHSCNNDGQGDFNHFYKKNNNINYYIRHKRVKCSGEDDNSNHPLIYLDIKENSVVACPYCGKEFRY